MSDLQCPARLVFVRAGEDSGDGAAGPIAEDLRDERVAALLAPPGGAAAVMATAVGALLLVPVTEDARLSAGVATPDDAAARLLAVGAEVADTHRGETVALVVDDDALGPALGMLCVNLSPALVGSGPPPTGTAAVVAVDSEGWVCRRWGPAGPGPS